MPQDEITLVLKGGLVYDGTGSDPVVADVGIGGDEISFIGDGAHSGLVLDVSGLAVSPGFVDVHGHSEFSLLADPSAEGKVLQGITTEINGNCGMSAAPMLGEAITQRSGDLEECGVDKPWEGFEEYFGLLERRGIGLNFATLTGHGSIRASVMGYDARRPTDGEMDRMRRLLAEALGCGALGLSTGLIYPPGIYAEAEEIVGLASYGSTLRGGRFVYASHMRSEGDRLVESINETIEVGRRSGAGVHISHLKTAGRRNWQKAGEAVALIERARADGLRVTCDRYPYAASSTDLDSVLPDWAFEGGNEEELRRLADPLLRRKISDELGSAGRDWAEVRVSSVDSGGNKWMEGLDLAEIARRKGTWPVEALLGLLLEERLRVGAVFHNMSEENLDMFLSLSYLMIGSDSSARSLRGPTARGKPHPRGFGSFPRFLRMRPGGLAGAISRITTLPCLTFGIPDRGRLAPGFKADVVVFDPRMIEDRATYDNPFQAPEGIVHVVVNGRRVVSDGRVTGDLAGRVLGRPAAL